MIATGLSGTIGKHLPAYTKSLKIDLAGEKKSFDSIEFKTEDPLIHLAGIVGDYQINKDEKYAIKVNIEGTKRLAQEYLKKSNSKFIYVSTSHVYARSQLPITENSKVLPKNKYGTQKYESELCLKEIFLGAPSRLLIIRVFSILDWDVKNFTLGGGIKKIARGDENYRLFNGDDIRDFLTPRIVAKALSFIVNSSTTFKVLNLCSGTGIRVGDAAKKMLNESNFKIPKGVIVNGISEDSIIIGDDTNLVSLIGKKLEWTPSVIQHQDLSKI